jgi:hypothetical protein
VRDREIERVEKVEIERVEKDRDRDRESRER